MALVSQQQAAAEENATDLVNVLVRPTGAESVEAELFVSILLPPESGHNLHTQGRNPIGQDLQTILFRLSVKNLPARHRHHAGRDLVIVLEVFRGLDTEAHLGACADQSNIRILGLVNHVATFDGMLQRRVFELRQILTRQSNDGRSRLAGESNVIRRRSLVTVSRTPNHAVGKGAEMSKRLDRLVRWPILSEPDRVVRSDVDDAELRERGQTDGTSRVGDKVKESTAIWDDCPIRCEPVHDRRHAMFAHAVPNVAAGPVAKA